MERLFVILGSLSAATGVAAGAFGAHALKGRLAAEQLVVFETGVRYQLVHALALLAVAWAAARWPGPATTAAGYLLFAGIVLFSGSLYALALGAPRLLGLVTPIGGLAFIAGWACLAAGALRAQSRQ